MSPWCLWVRLSMCDHVHLYVYMYMCVCPSAHVCSLSIGSDAPGLGTRQPLFGSPSKWGDPLLGPYWWSIAGAQGLGTLRPYRCHGSAQPGWASPGSPGEGEGLSLSWLVLPHVAPLPILPSSHLCLSHPDSGRTAVTDYCEVTPGGRGAVSPFSAGSRGPSRPVRPSEMLRDHAGGWAQICRSCPGGRRCARWGTLALQTGHWCGPQLNTAGQPFLFCKPVTIRPSLKDFCET